MLERFRVLYSKEADDFLDSLPQKAKDKILSNIRKAKYVLDPKLFKKLEGTDIWNSVRNMMEFNIACLPFGIPQLIL